MADPRPVAQRPRHRTLVDGTIGNPRKAEECVIGGVGRQLAEGRLGACVTTQRGGAQESRLGWLLLRTAPGRQRKRLVHPAGASLAVARRRQWRHVIGRSLRKKSVQASRSCAVCARVGVWAGANAGVNAGAGAVLVLVLVLVLGRGMMTYRSPMLYCGEDEP